MRIHCALAVASTIMLGLGLKLTVLTAPIAAADVSFTKGASIDTSVMHHRIHNLPIENFYDMTFAFPERGGSDDLPSNP